MFNDILYQQIDGVSMGGPLASSMANAFLSHLENNLLNDTSVTESYCIPKLFLRYVDDCFALFHTEAEPDSFLTLFLMGGGHNVPPPTK